MAAGTGGPNVLAELGALHLARPAAGAAPRVVGAWYERKAVVLEHLAAEGSRTARVEAEVAHMHARALGVAA
jgi:hypothetical protein